MKSTRAILFAATAFLVATPAATGMAQPAPRQPGVIGSNGLRTPIPKDGPVDLARAAVPDGFTFVATGDLLGPYEPLSGLSDPDFGKVVKIIQSGDVAFANHEGSAFDLSTFDGTRAPQNGGGYPLFDPATDRDFKTIGLDIVSMANNHAGDWGEQGLIETLKTVHQSGLIEAGAGGSMTQARQPAVFHTPKGRVALVATASTYNPASPAADGEGALKPRPGISVLRTTATNVVTAAEMALVRQLAASRSRTPADAATVRLGGSGFNLPNNPGVTYTDASQFGNSGAAFVVGDTAKITYTVNRDDETAVLEAITQAKQANEFVVFSIHAHENAGLADSAVPADFLPTLFHKAIDAGADVVIRHGPHELNGIEVYKGKPIFYSLGSLFFGVGGPDRKFNGRVQPANFYDNALAVTEYKAGKASVIRIYPLASVTDRPAIFSAPIIATGAEGQRIMSKIRKDSAAFGTDIKIENGIGIIRVDG